MKYLFIFCLLVALNSLATAKSVTWGSRSAKDRLLYQEHVIRFPLKDIVQEVYVTYPRLGSNVRNPGHVSVVSVFDRFTNSSGALPIRIIPTKPGRNSRFTETIVVLRSQRSQGINSTVELYGRKRQHTDAEFY